MTKTFNWALQQGIWAETWNTSIISVIYKEGKPPTDCTSYRPISLLNTDQKILSGIIADRLKKIVPSIINTDQTGFIMDRQMVDNVRHTLNIMEYSKNTQRQTILLTLDAEKAFDWSYGLISLNRVKALTFIIHLLIG